MNTKTEKRVIGQWYHKDGFFYILKTDPKGPVGMSNSFSINLHNFGGSKSEEAYLIAKLSQTLNAEREPS